MWLFIMARTESTQSSGVIRASNMWSILVSMCRIKHVCQKSKRALSSPSTANMPLNVLRATSCMCAAMILCFVWFSSFCTSWMDSVFSCIDDYTTTSYLVASFIYAVFGMQVFFFLRVVSLMTSAPRWIRAWPGQTRVVAFSSTGWIDAPLDARACRVGTARCRRGFDGRVRC